MEDIVYDLRWEEHMLNSQKSLYSNWIPRTPSIHPLPSYFKPPPSHMGTEEVRYLANKNAFSIPETWLRNDILRSYLEFVHPLMPILNIRELLDPIERGDGSLGKISLLLFQAIMFAGCTFVDMHSLEIAGFKNRREARKAFFQRARLLYDFEYESDRLSRIQAVLLLTYWYETPDDLKDAWHWMSVAVSLLLSIGLHLDPERSTLDIKAQHLWKRIWWCAFMRDRLITLALRRPTQIDAESSNVPMLELKDFDLRPLPAEMGCISWTCKVARDAEMQRDLANLCIQKVKLCQCISHIFSAQYAVVSKSIGLDYDEEVTRVTSMLMPKVDESRSSDVEACQEELEDWFQGASLRDHTGLDKSTPENIPTGHESLLLNTALLHLLYFTALSTLHRPQVMTSIPTTRHKAPFVEDTRECSRRTIQIAAFAITHLTNKLYDLDLIRFLPSTGVTVLVPAAIIHLLNIRSSDEPEKRASLKWFFQCMRFLRLLGENYPSADHSIALLEAAARKANIRIPMLKLEELIDLTFVRSAQASPSNYIGELDGSITCNTAADPTKEPESTITVKNTASGTHKTDWDSFSNSSDDFYHGFITDFESLHRSDT